jgi:hypothetical protein
VGFKCGGFIWVVFFPRFGSRRANFEAAARSLLPVAAPRACQCGVFLCVAQYNRHVNCILPGTGAVRKGQYPESSTIHMGASDAWQVERARRSLPAGGPA